MPWSARGIWACAASRCGPGSRASGWRGFSPRCNEAGGVARMSAATSGTVLIAAPDIAALIRATFFVPHDLRRVTKIRASLAGGRGRHLLRHAGTKGAQEDAGAAEGRRRQPGDAGRAARRARDAGGKPARDILLHRPLPRLSDGADPPVESQTRDRRAVAAAALAHAGVEEGGEGIR